MGYLIDVLARNPPATLFVIGIIMILTGSTVGIPELIKCGQFYLSCGSLLQVLWLIVRYR